MSEPLTVVVIAYHPGAALPRFLDTLAAATTAEVSTVIVDNAGGADPETAAAAKRPGVEVRDAGGNLGYGRAANLGASDALTDWVVVANPDVAWRPGSLDALMAAAERWPSAGALGPAILTPDGALYPSARLLPSLGRGVGHALLGWWWPTNPWTRAYRTEGGDPVEGPTGWLSGSCLLLRVSAFRQVGGFDPSYFMYFEDLDLCERLGRAGWRSVYVPGAVVSHIGAHATERHRVAMVREHHRSAYRYLSRKYAGPWWLPVRLALRAGLAARSGLSRLIARIGAGARPTRDAGTLHPVPAPPSDMVGNSAGDSGGCGPPKP